MNDRAKKNTPIAKKIKDLRESVNWTQSELARRAGITSAAISLIEKGDREPTVQVCRKLAEAFNVTIGELTGDKFLSSNEINDESQNFYRKFGNIVKLSKEDQKMLLMIIGRFLQKDRK